MQNMSRTLKEAIRSTYQAPLAKLEILNKDGSKAGEILDVIDVNLGVFSSREILRSLRVSIDNKDGQYTPDPDLFDKNFLWYNKKMKLYYGYKTTGGARRELSIGMGKNMRASSIYGPEYNPENLLDGVLNFTVSQRGWASNAAFPQWVELEFEEKKKIDQVSWIFGRTDNSNYCPVDYKILISETGDFLGEEKEVVNIKGNSTFSGWIDHMFSGVYGKFVRMVITKVNSASGSVTEFMEWKIYGSDLEEWLPQGIFNIGYIRTEVDPDGTTLELEGQDCIEDLHEDQFDDVYKAETTATESANYALAPAVATASTATAAGDEIQQQAKIHYIDTFATVNGLKTAVENESMTFYEEMLNETKNAITNHDFSLDSNGDGLADGWGKWGTGGTITWIDGLNGKGQRIEATATSSIGIYRADNPVKGVEIGEKVYISYVYKGDFPAYTYFMRSVPGNRSIGGALTPYYVVDIGNGWKRLFATYSNSEEKCDMGILIGLEGTVGKVAIIDDVYLSKEPFNQWEFIYNPKEGETVTEIESEIFLDLKDPLQLQEIKVNLSDGGQLTDAIFTSPDNATWTSYVNNPATPSGQIRYIKFKARKQSANADGSWSFGISEIQVKVNQNYPAASAIDADIYDTSWRPKPSDLNPWIQIDMGAAKSINAIYLYWGKNSFDFWNRVKYFIEHSTNGSVWTRLSDLNGYDETISRYGEVEHVFNAISPRYIRITLRGVDGIAILRHVRIQSITATKTIRDMMMAILDGTTFAGNYQLPYTRRYIERKMADIGDEKAKFLASLARTAGWEVNTDENGVYKAYVRNVDPVDYAWEFTPETDNIFSFGVTLSYDIKNVIVVSYESSDKKAIVGRAIDNDPLSPTSIQNLGRRVIHYSGESYNSQEICDRVAQERLFERTRQKHHTSLPTTGHPGIQVDDVIILTVDEAHVVQGYYLITGYETTFKSDNGEFDTRINISQI